MSEKEKEAIETLKNIVIQEYDWWIDKGDYAESNVKETEDAIKTILKLIEKQQKEIDKLKEQNKKYQGIENGTTIIYKAKAKYVREDRIEKYYIDKNKIREKIKELENCIDKPIVKLKVLQHGFAHEANTQFIIKTIINILSEILGE